MRKKSLWWIFGAVSLLVTAIAAQTTAASSPQRAIPQHSQISPSYGNLPLTFEPNQGQTDAQAKFLTRGNGYSAFLTAGGMVLSLHATKVLGPQQTSVAAPSQVPSPSLKTTLQFNLLGAAQNPTAVGEDRQSGRVNYFIGRDPKLWRTNVPTYAKVRYKSVYPGIDLVYYGNRRQLEYDFEVAATGNPNLIQFEITGANGIAVDSNGDLVLKTNAGELHFQSPVVYQETNGRRLAVDGRYAMKDPTHIGFRIAQYDPSKPLVIDPVLVYSTYLGGSEIDQPNAIAIDTTGCVYVAGGTSSPDFPGATVPPSATTEGAANFAAGYAFAAKLDPTGSTLLFADYIGGSGGADALALVLDGTNNLYLAGGTASDDFPLVNPFQGVNLGLNYTSFVTEVSADGSSLLYSTYLGGTGNDHPNGIALDDVGGIVVAGQTSSTDFPVANAFQPTVSANQGGVYGGYGFLTDFVPDGSSLAYSTYLGGSSMVIQTCSSGPCWLPPGSGISGLAVDGNGNAYVSGSTNTYDFPSTPGAYQSTDSNQSVAVGFVSKFNASGGLVYSTFLYGVGGNETGADAIAVDSSGSAYVTGQAISDGTFPITSTSICDPGVYGLECGYSYVAKFDPTGSTLLYSTFLGPNNYSAPVAIALDGSNNAYLVGSTHNCSSFEAVEGIESCQNATTNLLLVEIDQTGSTEVFATNLGGSTDSAGTGTEQYAVGVAVDSADNIYVGGATYTDDFPTTGGAFQETLNGQSNTILLKIAPDSAPSFSASPFLLQYATQQVGSTSPATIALLRNMGSTPLLISSVTVSGDYSESNTCENAVPAAGSCTFSVTFSPTTGGPRSGSIVIGDNAAGSPHVINLIGDSPDGLIALTPTSLIFASQAFETPSTPQQLTLGNNGNTALKVDNIQVSGDFAQTNNCPTTLPAASKCAIQIVFTPTALGIRSGTLSVTDNVQLPQTLKLSGTGSDFNLRSSTPTETITAGKTATYNLTVAPVGGSFSNAVKLSCGGLPAQTTCSFSPSVVTPGGTAATATMTINTAASVAATQPTRLFANSRLYTIWISIQGMGLLGIMLAGHRSRPKEWRFSMLMALLIVILVFMTACTGNPGVAPQPQSGTPAGTYKITVMGSSGALQHSASLTLIVQ